MAKSTKKTVKKSVKRAVRASKRTTKPPRKPSRKPTPKAIKPASATKPTPKFHSPVPRSSSNPFREGSAYAVTFDILASNTDGMTRQDLIAAVSKATGKDERHASFDVAVVLSAKEDGERHQSCRPGFWVEREGDCCKLRTA